MHPSIQILPPIPGVSKDHHYIPPPKSSYLPSIPYLTTPIKKPVAGPFPTPYFQNPWPSYRSASLSDVYTAYMKGAEIALPRQDGKETEQLMSESVQESGHGGRDGNYKDVAEEERVEDDEEDWREPPVDVKETDGSIWDEPSQTESVTWLGHAGVLLQLPWREGKGKQGMCNILFDPIFSYRSVLRQVAKLISAGVRLPNGLDPLAMFLHLAKSRNYPLSTCSSYPMITVSLRSFFAWTDPCWTMTVTDFAEHLLRDQERNSRLTDICRETVFSSRRQSMMTSSPRCDGLITA